jgi:hypothetical protein
MTLFYTDSLQLDVATVRGIGGVAGLQVKGPGIPSAALGRGSPVEGLSKKLLQARPWIFYVSKNMRLLSRTICVKAITGGFSPTFAGLSGTFALYRTQENTPPTR